MKRPPMQGPQRTDVMARADRRRSALYEQQSEAFTEAIGGSPENRLTTRQAHERFLGDARRIVPTGEPVRGIGFPPFGEMGPDPAGDR